MFSLSRTLLIFVMAFLHSVDSFRTSIGSLCHKQFPITRSDRRNVHLSGRTALQSSFRSSFATKPLIRPPNPQNLLSTQQIQEHADRLAEWMLSQQNIVVITGAGLSTESGIPDYRGHTGSYHEGHKPVLHDQFLASDTNRRRYWGRSMVRGCVCFSFGPSCITTDLTH
jgi:hypothetical protein